MKWLFVAETLLFIHQHVLLEPVFLQPLLMISISKSTIGQLETTDLVEQKPIIVDNRVVIGLFTDREITMICNSFVKGYW